MFAVIGIGSAGATTQTKFYGASVSPSSGVAAKSRVTYTLTLKNKSNSTQTIGSSNFWAPSGWTVNSVPSIPVTSPDGHSWNISMQSGSTSPNGTNDDVVKFRAATSSDALAPGQMVQASVDATASCTTGAALWQTETKQANSFSGSPGNDFQPAAGDLNTTVTVGAAALGSFVFDAIPTQTTGVSFTVTVTAYDSCLNKKTDYGGGATLSGNLTGISTYPLTWDPHTPGVGTASLTPIASQFSAKLHVADGAIAADSNTFNVLDTAGQCTATSGPCDVGNGTTTVDSTLTGSQKLDIGLISGAAIGSFTPTAVNGCTAGAPLGDEALVTIDPTGYTSAFTITLTYAKSIAPGTGVSNFVVCKSNDNGATWEQLSLCNSKHPSPPCIVSRSRTGVGALVETLYVSPTDPAWGTD